MLGLGGRARGGVEWRCGDCPTLVDYLHHIGSEFYGFTGLACHPMQPGFLQTLLGPVKKALHGRSLPFASLGQAA